jgi:hypothetical protein
MPALFRFFLTLVISISLGGADANAHAAAASTGGSPVDLSEPASLNIPPWAIHIPEHSFVGISSPCRSVEEARQQAVDSVISQILQSMGAEYHLTHESTLSGSLHESRYEMKERLSYNAKWLLESVQQNIRRYAFQETGTGHVCFVLVQMRPSELERLKKLTIGARLTARMIGTNGGHATIEVSESNGVGVTLTEYRVTVASTNRNARLITLFVWKVPESEVATHEGVLPTRLFLKTSTRRTAVSVSTDENQLKSVLMGSKQAVSITLSGYDEIGRPVSVPVRLQ